MVLLVGKFARLSRALELPQRSLQASGNPRDAKALATMAYPHNASSTTPAASCAPCRIPNSMPCYMPPESMLQHR